MIYKYGMQMQRYSPKTAPLFGLIDRKADREKKFYDILFYDRKLTATEIYAYGLILLGEAHDYKGISETTKKIRFTN